MREQDNWLAHATIMDELTDERFVVLGGPRVGGRRVPMIVETADEASIRARLAADPWSGTHLRIERIEAWELLLRAPSQLRRRRE
jgi:hypothetical protein